MCAGLWTGKAAVVVAVKLGSFTESQAKTDHNNFQTSCLGQKHFVFIMVIKALDQQFNLPFPHPLARGQKTKQGRGGKEKSRPHSNLTDILSLCRHCRHEYGFWEVTLNRPSKHGSEISYQHHTEQTLGHSQQCLGNSSVGWLSWFSEA